MDFKINLTAELDNLSVADIISLSALDGLGDIIKNLQKSQKLNIEIPSSSASTKTTNFKEVEDAKEEQEEKPVSISIDSAESLISNAAEQKKAAKEKYADLIEKVTKELFKFAQEAIVSGDDYIAIGLDEIEGLTDEEKSWIKNDPLFNTIYREALRAKCYRGSVWNDNDGDVRLHLAWNNL